MILEVMYNGEFFYPGEIGGAQLAAIYAGPESL